MQSKSVTRFLAAGLLSLAALSGCAHKDIDNLKTELAAVKATADDAKSTADQAQQEAQAANSTAADAKATADDAKATADEAKAMAEANSDRLDRMFKKAMHK